jgi:hypothetical protein
VSTILVPSGIFGFNPWGTHFFLLSAIEFTQVFFFFSKTNTFQTRVQARYMIHYSKQKTNLSQRKQETRVVQQEKNKSPNRPAAHSAHDCTSAPHAEVDDISAFHNLHVVLCAFFSTTFSLHIRVSKWETEPKKKTHTSL